MLTQALLEATAADSAPAKDATVLNLRYHDITEIDEKIHFSEKLVKLDLGGNQLTSLPENLFFGLEHLKELDLSGNKLSSLPESIFQGLPNLRILRLGDNALKSIPESMFFGLPALKELSLKSNQLRSLPRNVFSKSLVIEKLDVEDNPMKWESCEFYGLVREAIVTLPDGEKAMELLSKEYGKNIEVSPEFKVSVTGLSIMEISDKFMFPPMSREIDLRWNHLSTLPRGIFQKLNLREINLTGNKLNSLPETVFYGLANLKTLDLRWNKLTKLPEKLFQGLLALEHLYLWENELVELPSDIFNKLTDLKEIYLCGNQLKSLPNGLFRGLPNLKAIDLQENPLQWQGREFYSIERRIKLTLPIADESEEAVTLTQEMIDERKAEDGFLSFAGLGITEIEEKVQFPVELTFLNLSGNRLKSLPKSVFHGLRKLEKLDLEGNLMMEFLDRSEYDLHKSVIVYLPEDREISLELLSQKSINLLKIDFGQINLRGVQLKEIEEGLDFPQGAAQIDLRWNKLNEIPERMFYGLMNLKEIDLGGNKLNSISPLLFKGLINLTHVFLWENNISSIPEGLFNGLINLKEIYLSGNQIASIPRSSFRGLKLDILDLVSNPLNWRDRHFYDIREETLVLLPNGRMSIENLTQVCLNSLKLKDKKLDLSRMEIKRFKEHIVFPADISSLDLSENKIITLHPGMFDGLSNLRFISLRGNQLTRVPKNQFRGLNLKTLSLEANPLQWENHLYYGLNQETEVRLPSRLSFQMTTSEVQAVDDKILFVLYFLLSFADFGTDIASSVIFATNGHLILGILGLICILLPIFFNWYTDFDFMERFLYPYFKYSKHGTQLCAFGSLFIFWPFLRPFILFYCSLKGESETPEFLKGKHSEFVGETLPLIFIQSTLAVWSWIEVSDFEFTLINKISLGISLILGSYNAMRLFCSMHFEVIDAERVRIGPLHVPTSLSWYMFRLFFFLKQLTELTLRALVWGLVSAMFDGAYKLLLVPIVLVSLSIRYLIQLKFSPALRPERIFVSLFMDGILQDYDIAHGLTVILTIIESIFVFALSYIMMAKPEEVSSKISSDFQLLPKNLLIILISFIWSKVFFEIMCYLLPDFHSGFVSRRRRVRRGTFSKNAISTVVEVQVLDSPRNI